MSRLAMMLRVHPAARNADDPPGPCGAWSAGSAQRQTQGRVNCRPEVELGNSGALQLQTIKQGAAVTVSPLPANVTCAGAANFFTACAGTTVDPEAIGNQNIPIARIVGYQ
jgi:hypothetical protein